MRASVRHEVRIGRPADEVWSIAGRPELLHHWFPGVVECRVDGDARTIITGTGQEMVETILTHDAIQRRFQYRLESRLFRDHLGTLDVIDLGDDSCLVVYATDADPATMAITIAGGTHGALLELQRQVEAGAGPALEARDAAVTTDVAEVA